jgi:hypothetical protein
MRTTFPAHLILLYLITLIIHYKEYKSIFEVPHYPVLTIRRPPTWDHFGNCEVAQDGIP